MRILVDATTVIALGTIGELDLLSVFDGDVRVPSEVQAEVTTEPARTTLDRLLADPDSSLQSAPVVEDRYLDRATSVLDEGEDTGDVRLVAGVLRATDRTQPIAVVSDDRRVRTVCRGLGATVTGTIGVIVRAVDEGLPAQQGRRLVQELDRHGLHMTGELRDRAVELIDESSSE